MAEIMKDAELDAVVGGSGIECMGLMARLQSEGLATFKTPLVAGNEKAAANELQAYLKGLNIKNLHFELYSDDAPNSYSLMECKISSPIYTLYEGVSISADDVVGLVKKHFGVI